MKQDSSSLITDYSARSFFNSRFFLLSVLILLLISLAARFNIKSASTLEISSNTFNQLKCRKVKEWQDKFGKSEDLQVAEISIHFPSSHSIFTKTEGAVSMPLGSSVPGGQEILDIYTYPEALDIPKVEGTNVAVWVYPGQLPRELNYYALTLARRSKGNEQNLPEEIKFEALVKSADLPLHSLRHCASFVQWVKDIAGPLPASSQFLRVAEFLSQHPAPPTPAPQNPRQRLYDKREADLCAALRQEKFTSGQMASLAVMAARELQIPSFAFSSAKTLGRHIVGIHTGANGWEFINFDDANPILEKTSALLLSKMPLRTRCTFCSNFESAAAIVLAELGAFGGSDSMYYAVAKTGWNDEQNAIALVSGITKVSTATLSDLCK